MSDEIENEPKRRRGRPKKVQQVASTPLMEHDGAPTPHPGAAPTDPALVSILNLLATRGSIGADEFKAILNEHREEIKKERYPQVPHPEISVFSHEKGDRWAREHGEYKKLDRIIYLNGNREDIEALTYTEVDAYNEFSRKMGGPGSELMARNGKWKATVTANGNEIHITLPNGTLEDNMNGPISLLFFIREFLDGPEATDPNHLMISAARLKALEAKFAALEAAGQPLVQLA